MGVDGLLLVGYVHLPVNWETFVALTTFSSGLKCLFWASKPNMTHQVCTRNRAEAVEPVVCPVAVTVWLPGVAEPGTFTLWENFVCTALAVPITVASKVIVTLSFWPKPLPLTVNEEYGRPKL